MMVAGGGGLVGEGPAPGGELTELGACVLVDPARIELVRRSAALCEMHCELVVAPHAGQQGGKELGVVAERRDAQEEVRVGAGGWSRTLVFQLGGGDSPFGGVAAVKLQLAPEHGAGQLGEAGHRLQLRRASAAECEQAC